MRAVKSARLDQIGQGFHRRRLRRLVTIRCELGEANDRARDKCVCVAEEATIRVCAGRDRRGRACYGATGRLLA